LSAPVPPGDYDPAERESFGSKAEIERNFAVKHGDDVPEDYMQWIDGELENNIEYNVTTCVDHEIDMVSLEFDSPVLYMMYSVCCSRDADASINVDLVITRPCAEGYGLYRYLLWGLADIVVRHELDWLTVTKVLPHNRDILTGMGFHLFRDGELDSHSAEISYEELAEITEEMWDVPKREEFPAASVLNDPAAAGGRRAVSEAERARRREMFEMFRQRNEAEEAERSAASKQ